MCSYTLMPQRTSLRKQWLPFQKSRLRSVSFGTRTASGLRGNARANLSPALKKSRTDVTGSVQRGKHPALERLRRMRPEISFTRLSGAQ